MAVLLVSPDGMLGRAWHELLAREGMETVQVSHPGFDLTKPESIDGVDWTDIDTVINCSAWTDVDGAEADEEAATAVNGTGVETLARRAAEEGALLVHYSTDYVFDGQASEPYPVDHPRSPVNAYGRSKAAGEVAIEAVGGAHLIVRTSWLYAPWGNNFVRTMLRLGAERDSLRVVADQRGRPTSAEHLAATTLKLMRADARGLAHVTDGGACTWHEFAQAIIATVNPSCDVQPCTTAEFPRPAPRPAFSVLDLSRTEALVGPMPPWTDNLSAVLAALT